jgi:hypothetical protein
LREVTMAMKYGGVPCNPRSETLSCNAQACEKDCELSSWTKWSRCSKDCDGGTAKRQKFIKKGAEGTGKCANGWSSKRLQYKECNMNRCKTPMKDFPLACNKSLDVVLLLDGSGSLGKTGWNAEIEAAQLFVDAFSNNSKANMAVILFSGPRTWSGVRKCFHNKKVDMEKTCGIRTITHFTDDMKEVKRLITNLHWPRGSTLTSLALMTAKAELALGRKNSPANVIVFTDGRPLSYRSTSYAATNLRKSARLLWVPVTGNAPLKYIKKWATRRWQENVVLVKSFNKLKDPTIITHIIANICPSKQPKIEIGRSQ